MHVTCGCSCDSGWDTLLARNACSYIEKHLSTAVMSASSILLVYLSSYPNPTSHPSSKTHMFEDSTRDEVIAVDCPTVFCSCCYRRFMANTSEMNKWSSVSRNDKIQKLREAKGPTLSQNWYHVHQFTLMINWTLFQFQTPHDDLIGLWWSFEAGNVFESKLSVSARNGEHSFCIWSPHNREGFGHEVKIHPHRYRCKMEAHGQLQLGGSLLFMRIKPMVGYEVTWYFTAVLDLFGFLLLFEFLKSDKSLIPMWAAPAAEWCFECINDISTRSTIIKKHFSWIQNWRWYNDSKYEYIDGDMRLGRQFFMSTLGECDYVRYTKPCISDNSRFRNPLVENEDSSMHLWDHSQRHSPEDKQHEETNSFCSLLMVPNKMNRIFIPRKCQQVGSKRRDGKKTASPDHLRWNFLGQVAKLHQDL